jgi:uncharacterized membrane protein YeaQ/YmgE (transglycosylase-associated protein family)
MSWIWIIIIGGIAGWLAGLIVAGRGFGIIWDIVLGVIGALLGNLILNALGLNLSYFLNALIGAIVILFISKLFSRGN